MPKSAGRFPAKVDFWPRVGNILLFLEDVVTVNPPGWSYNPSEWTERIPIVVLSVVGFVIASYMALFQLELIDTVWEPFFGDGTRDIVISEISEAFPIPAMGQWGNFLRNHDE